MDWNEIDQERIERPGAQAGDTLADPEVVGPDEDRATGSEGTGRLVGLGEVVRRRPTPDSPTRLPD